MGMGIEQLREAVREFEERAEKKIGDTPLYSDRYRNALREGAKILKERIALMEAENTPDLNGEVA
jgi:hypothetical protein